jgi:ankyrin repeat protein
MSAARRGDLEKLKAHLHGGLPIDVMESDGTTALMEAANQGHAEIVTFLLENGANPNRKDEYGEYALTSAAMGGESKTFDVLYHVTEPRLRKRADKMKEAMIQRNGIVTTWTGRQPRSAVVNGLP